MAMAKAEIRFDPCPAKATQLQMKKIIRQLGIFITFAAMLAAIHLPTTSLGEEGMEPALEERETIDEAINRVVTPWTGRVFDIVFFKVPFIKIGEEQTQIPFILLWLAGAGLFLTIYFRFINFRSWKLAYQTIRGRFSSPDDPGEISHFRALTTALSATVGLGNIAGVAIAIATGGPGATFWMVLAGFLGMTTKFAESILGVKYRQINGDGKVSGGPMHYLTRGLAERGMATLGRTLAVLFAILCVGASLGGGNMFQVNQATRQFVSVTGLLEGHEWVFGLIIAIIVGFVIIGGVVRIASVTSRLVPFMCGTYVLAALVILFANFTAIPAAIGTILSSAFSSQAIAGGMIGVLLIGIQRAVFSNEAGIGSAPIAHAAVKTKHPASEGFVAMFGPFVDTVIVCTMTALVIVITGSYENPDQLNGVELTSLAFDSVIPGFRFILSITVILFAFSTLISWSYYGLQAFKFLFGDNRTVELTFKLIYCGFVIIGAPLTLSAVTDFSDGMLLGMCFPNLIGVFILLPVIRNEVRKYREATKSQERRLSPGRKRCIPGESPAAIGK